MEPELRFCTSADGTRIAYTTFEGGLGPPLVSVNSFFVSEQRIWEQDGGRAIIEGLAEGRRLFTFDRRGIGASQREVDDLSLEAHVADLAAVVDHLGLARFDLVGWADGAAVSVAYAAQYPERVARLALYKPYPRGEGLTDRETARSVMGLIRASWPLAQRTLVDLAEPDAPAEVRHTRANALRRDVSQEVAAKYFEFLTTLDITTFLPRVQAPTLVLVTTLTNGGAVPVSVTRAVAALIPDARFSVVETQGPSSDSGETARFIRQFLDEGRVEPVSDPASSTGMVTILFTDMAASTQLADKLGDAAAQEVRRAHNEIVRSALDANDGNEIKHTGDGIMASFQSASAALDCAIAIQQDVAAHKVEHPDSPLGVYIGLNAGEPIVEDGDLFGTSVDLAARLVDHAQPGQIIASDVVRQLAAGKDFLFADLGETELRGFEDPVKLWELRWRG